MWKGERVGDNRGKLKKYSVTGYCVFFLCFPSLSPTNLSDMTFQGREEVTEGKGRRKGEREGRRGAKRERGRPGGGW